jgi:hypothetical protein
MMLPGEVLITARFIALTHLIALEMDSMVHFSMDKLLGGQGIKLLTSFSDQGKPNLNKVQWINPTL